MTTNKKLEWILRIGVAGEFLGHGIFALQGKADWISGSRQPKNASITLRKQRNPLVKGV